MKTINLALAQHNLDLYQKNALHPESKLYIRNDKFYLIDLKGESFLTSLRNFFIKIFSCLFNQNPSAINLLYQHSKWSIKKEDTHVCITGNLSKKNTAPTSKNLYDSPSSIDIDLLQTQFLSLRNEVEKLTETYRKSPGRLNDTRITPKTIIDFQEVIDSQINLSIPIQKKNILKELKTGFSGLIDSFYKNITSICETEDISNLENQRGLTSIIEKFPNDELKEKLRKVLDERIDALHTSESEIRSSEPPIIPPAFNQPSAAPILEKALDHYDHQIFLNLGRGISARGIAEKRKSRGGSESITIDLKTPPYSLDPLRHLTSHSRVYIIGHCHTNAHEISSDAWQTKTAQEYANMIATHAPHLAIRDPDGRVLKIRLYACYAASGENSFARQLSQALFEKRIIAEVTGRTGPVPRWDETSTFRKKTSDPKLSFTGNGTQQLL